MWMLVKIFENCVCFDGTCGRKYDDIQRFFEYNDINIKMSRSPLTKQNGMNTINTLWNTGRWWSILSLLRKNDEGALQIGSALGALLFLRNLLWHWYWELHTSQLEVSFSTRKFYGSKPTKLNFSNLFL